MRRSALTTLIVFGNLGQTKCWQTMGRLGEGDGGPQGWFGDVRYAGELSRRMTAAAQARSRGCAERILDGIGASTSDVSSSETAETRRARREFADGGTATGTSSLRDESGFVSLTWTPRKPAATFLRASPLDRARGEFSPSIYSASGEEHPPDTGDDPTNDASSGTNLSMCGDDGGVMIDATVNRGRSRSQLQFLSNLAEQRRWDDASVGTKWTLLESGKMLRRDTPWWWGRRRKNTASPEVSANALVHWDTFGDRTVELEVKKQAATSSGGSASCVRGGSLARIMTVSQAWCANLAGDEGRRIRPRVELMAAGELGPPGDKDNPPSYFRCKLTTDVTAMKHWLAAEIRAGGVMANLWLLSHVRIFTDFNTSHATRPRIVFRSKESEPAPGRLAWHLAYSATCSTPPTRPHALFHYNDVIDVTVRSTRTEDIDDGNERMIGAKIESGQGPDTHRVSALKARIRASFSAPTTSSDDVVDKRSVECVVSRSHGWEGIGLEWRREWRAGEGNEGGDPPTFASVRVTALDPSGRGPAAFCEINNVGTLRDDLVLGRVQTC